MAKLRRILCGISTYLGMVNPCDRRATHQASTPLGYVPLCLPCVRGHVAAEARVYPLPLRTQPVHTVFSGGAAINMAPATPSAGATVDLGQPSGETTREVVRVAAQRATAIMHEAAGELYRRGETDHAGFAEQCVDAITRFAAGRASLMDVRGHSLHAVFGEHPCQCLSCARDRLHAVVESCAWPRPSGPAHQEMHDLRVVLRALDAYRKYMPAAAPVPAKES